MKVGDLVYYAEGWPKRNKGQEGIIIGGPDRSIGYSPQNRWKVFWPYCNKTGYWDEFRLEVINESR